MMILQQTRGVLSSGLDADARNYIAAVEAADGQELETSTRLAVNAFVKGCKTDGIWDAIKSCCILAGARTLSGALVPLKGTAPTNFNFVSDDYNRRTGLLGNGTTKYLASNRNNNADPQNNRHKAGYITQVSSINGAYFGAGTNNIGSDHIRKAALVFARSVNELQFSHSQPITSLGLYGMSRSSSASYQFRVNGVTDTITNTSQTPYNQNNTVFGRVGAAETNGRMSFYSIGESLDLALLDSRVTTLMSSIDAAIPQSYFVFGETIEYYDFSDEVVPDGMFASRSDLTSAVIADNVVTIGANAFAQCVNLSSVTLSNNLVTIGNNAFALCTSLTSITIPDSVTTIVADAFTSCESLAEVTIGSGVTSIPSGVFSDCHSLTNIVIPDNVTSIGSGAFYNCFNLTSITLSNNLVSIEPYAFYYCTSLTSITTPDSVTSIGDAAFGICFSLGSITLSNNLLTIGELAFDACAFASITIPNSVVSIGRLAFSSSVQLDTINCYVERSVMNGNDDTLIDTVLPITIHARATDSTWTAGSDTVGGATVTVVKDL